MGVDHRGIQAAVAQQLLDRANVVASFEQVRRNRMAQRVAAAGLRDACGTQRLLKDALHQCLVQMMAAPLAGRRVLVHPRRRARAAFATEIDGQTGRGPDGR